MKESNGNNGKPQTWRELERAFEIRNLDLKEETQSLYKYRVGLFITWLEDNEIPFDGLTASAVEDYCGNLRYRKGKKKGESLLLNTISGHERNIRKLLRYARKMKILPELIEFEMTTVPEKKPKGLSNDQFAKLRDLDKTSLANAIVGMILDSAIRRTELTKLCWGHLHWNHDKDIGGIVIRDGKGGRDRTTFYSERTNYHLQKYAKENNVPQGDSDPVFLNRNRRGYKQRGIDGLMVRLSEELGFKVRCHILRNTMAYRYIERGGNDNTLGKIMGNSNTQVFTQARPIDAESQMVIIFGKW